MTTVGQPQSDDEYRRWLITKYHRLYTAVERDMTTACGLDQALIDLRLRDIAVEAECEGWLAAVRSLNELVRDLDGVCWAPGQEVTA